MQAPAHALLGAETFPGPALGMDAVGGSFVGEAIFDGCVVFTHWPRREAAGLLPADFELAANLSRTPDLHPVVFVFGEMSESSVISGGLRFRWGMRYRELTVAVPFVKHRSGRYLHTWMPRIFSSYFPTVWNGNTYWGYPKQMARMGWEGPIWAVSGEDGALQLQVAVQPRDDWAKPRPTRPEVEAARAFSALPVAGHRAERGFVGSYFQWSFDSARVRGIDAGVGIDAAFAPGVLPGHHRDATRGSFEVRGMVWRISWPAACRF